MVAILALCIALAALVASGGLLRKRLRRGSGPRKRRYFSVDLDVPSTPPPVKPAAPEPQAETLP